MACYAGYNFEPYAQMIPNNILKTVKIKSGIFITVQVDEDKILIPQKSDIIEHLNTTKLLVPAPNQAEIGDLYYVYISGYEITTIQYNLVN